MNEYDLYYATIYDLYSNGVVGDVEFYVEEAKKAGSPVLELGCGTGRITIPIAKSGVRITGFDRSSPMLSIAKQKIQSLDQEIQDRIHLAERDMRNFSLEESFRLVIIPFRAFLHLLNEEDQIQALKCIRRHLMDDGHLILDVFDPNLDIIKAYTYPSESPLTKIKEFTYPQTGNRITVSESRQYYPDSQIMVQSLIFEGLDDRGVVISTTPHKFNVRYVFRDQMLALFKECGYKVESLYGDFQRKPYPEGGQQIWVVSKTDPAGI